MLIALASIAAVVLIARSRSVSDAPSPQSDGERAEPRRSSGGRTLSSIEFHDGLAIERSSGIEGRVSTADGAAVAGAVVCAVCQDARFGDVERRDPICARSGSDGRYALVELLPVAHTVSALAEAFALEWYVDARTKRAIDLAPGEVRAGIDIVLTTRGVPVRGVVEDVLGGVVPGARVALASRWMTVPSGAAVETNEQGEFALWVTPGNKKLRVSAHGYASHDFETIAPADGARVQLVPESAIRGRVVTMSEKRPVLGAAVHASRQQDGRESSAISDAEGRFEIDRLIPGRYRLWAEHATGYGESLASVSVGLAADREVVLELHPAASLPMRALDAATERGIAGCSLEVSSSPLQLSREAKTSTGGRGTVTGLLAGEYGAWIRCDGYQSESSSVTVALAENAEVAMRLQRAERGAMLKGRVVSPSGRMLSDVDVDLQRVGRADRAIIQVRAGEGGAFQFARIEAGHFQAWASVDFEPVSDAVEFEVVEGIDPPPIEIALRPMGSILGLVVDEAGAPIVRAHVDTGRRGVITGIDGWFRVSDVALGEYSIYVYEERSGLLRSPGKNEMEPNARVTVSTAEPVEITIVVERKSGVIRGTVVDGAGAPIPDALVSAQRAEPRAGRSSAPSVSWAGEDRGVVTDGQGAFRIEGLAEGSYVLVAATSKGEGIARGVAAGSAVTIVVERSGRASGIIELEDRSRPERFSVTVDHEARNLSRTESFLRSDGRWTIEDLPPGVLRFGARVDDARGSRSAAIVAEVAPGADLDDLVIRFEPEGAVRGRFVDLQTGAALASVGLQWAPLWGNEGVLTSAFLRASDASGAFLLEHLPPGKSRIYGFLMQPRYGLASVVVDVRSGETINLGDVPMVKARASSQPGDLGLDFEGTPRPADQLRIERIAPGGAAARAGLSAGDVIVSVDGYDVTGPRTYLGLGLFYAPAGTKLSLMLAGGRAVTLVLGAR